MVFPGHNAEPPTISLPPPTTSTTLPICVHVNQRAVGSVIFLGETDVSLGPDRRLCHQNVQLYRLPAHQIHCLVNQVFGLFFIHVRSPGLDIYITRR
jgi:hypothetical protein